MTIAEFQNGCSGKKCFRPGSQNVLPITGAGNQAVCRLRDEKNTTAGNGPGGRTPAFTYEKQGAFADADSGSVSGKKRNRFGVEIESSQLDCKAGGKSLFLTVLG